MNMKQTDQEILEQNEELRTKCTIYTRVMGYHRPVETFNAGKQGEFLERKHFCEPESAIQQAKEYSAPLK